MTLTADPEVFQRELRELYVQVGCPTPLLAACSFPSPSLTPRSLPHQGPKMAASRHGHALPPNTASGLHPSLGMLSILSFLGFLPLFSDPRTSGSPWALPIVGAYYLVTG